MTIPPASRHRPRRPAWAGRNYTLLTAAAVVTGLGNAGALIAAAFAVLGRRRRCDDVGLVAAARTIPLVVFLLIGGAVADRLPRQRVMVAANIVNCLLPGPFAALVLTGDPAVADGRAHRGRRHRRRRSSPPPRRACCSPASHRAQAARPSRSTGWA